MKTVFYRCPICGNVMLKVAGGNVVPTCCGKPMEELQPNITEGKGEYHRPEVTCCGKDVKVKVGKEFHPMLENHHIQFVYAETEKGGVLHFFNVGENPEVVLPTKENLIAVFAYCNLHNLWCVYL